MASTKFDKPGIKKESVTLIAPHKHEGKAYIAGANIEVTAKQKAFLERHKRIAVADKPAQ